MRSAGNEVSASATASIVANGNPDTGNGGNPDRAQCINANEGANNLPTPLGLPTNFLTAQTATAQTSITPELGFAIAQTADAKAKVENLGLLFNVAGNNLPAIGVGAAQSEMVAKCVAGSVVPQIAPVQNNVATLTLGGQPINLDPLVQQLSAALRPLGFLITIIPNETFNDATSAGINALHIKVIPVAGGPPVVDVVAAQSKVGFSGRVCDPNAQFPPGVGILGGPGDDDSDGLENDGDNSLGVIGNGTIGTANGPFATCGKLNMYFTRRGKHTRSTTNTFGNRLVTRGRLVTCGAHPLPIINAKIDVVHIIRGKRHLIKTGLKSRPRGRLTLILPLNLHTRSIEYGYRPNLNSTVVSSKVTLKLRVFSARTGRELK